MYQLVYSTQFKKDFKKITKLPIADFIEVGNIISRLQRGESLDTKHVNHPPRLSMWGILLDEYMEHS
jgi:mRNA interferase YafQ